MPQLTPCPSCQRHIRVSSVVCPFCDAATVPAQLSETRAARRAPLQKGVKRAVLFAVGAGLTQAACGEEPMAQAIYGAPIATTDTTDATTTSTGSATTTAVSPTTTGDSDTTELAQPVYGAPIDTTDVNTSGNDSTEVNQPVYGAPVPPDASATDASAEGGVDAGLLDASLDDDDADTTELAQPVYGAPVDTTDDATSTKTDTINQPDGGLIVPLYGAIPAEVE